MSPSSTVGAGASAAIRDRVAGRPARVEVLAVFPAAVYLACPPADGGDESPGGIVAVVAADGVAHPNAIRLAASTAARPFTGVTVGAVGRLGDHQLDLPGLHVEVRRWWRPRPVLAPITREALDENGDALDLLVATAATPLPCALAAPLGRLRLALQAGDTAAATAQVDGLLGLGPGLTPSGDDLLCGVLAAVTLLGPAVGADEDAPTPAAARAVGAVVSRRAPWATTSISAALLGHAARGEVSAVAADVLHALTGRQPLAPAVRALLAVGATSGRDLTAGLLAGTRAVAAGRLVALPALTEETR